MSSRNVVDLRKKRPGARVPAQAPLVLRPQKRVSPVRIRRRRLKMVIASYVAALLVAGALCLSYVSYLPRYSVESIQVTGAQATSAKSIVDFAQTIIYDGSHHFFSRANVLLYPKAVIEQDIPREFPRVASATITGDAFSNSITITIVERQAFAIWCSSDSIPACYAMDQGGFIFSQVPPNATSSGEYVFTGGVSTSSAPIGQTFVPGHTQGLVAFLQLLGQSGFTPLGASVQNDQDFIVPLSQGFSVYASFGEDPGALVNNLQLVLTSNALAGQQQNLQYVDLRFGNKVYYKLKGQAQGVASSTKQK